MSALLVQRLATGEVFAARSSVEGVHVRLTVGDEVVARTEGYGGERYYVSPGWRVLDANDLFELELYDVALAVRPVRKDGT